MWKEGLFSDNDGLSWRCAYSVSDTQSEYQAMYHIAESIQYDQ